MTSATLAADLDHEPDLARGYNQHDKDVTPGDFTGAWAAGGVVASAADIAAFYRALYTGRLVPRGVVADMGRARGTLPDGARYGLGTFVLDVDCTTATGPFGEIAGFESAAMHDPGTGRTVITLVNASGPLGMDAAQGLTFRALCYS